MFKNFTQTYANRHLTPSFNTSLVQGTDMDESWKHNAKQKKSDIKILHFILFYWYDILEKANL